MNKCHNACALNHDVMMIFASPHQRWFTEFFQPYMPHHLTPIMFAVHFTKKSQQISPCNRRQALRCGAHGLSELCTRPVLYRWHKLVFWTCALGRSAAHSGSSKCDSCVSGKYSSTTGAFARDDCLANSLSALGSSVVTACHYDPGYTGVILSVASTCTACEASLSE